MTFLYTYVTIVANMQKKNFICGGVGRVQVRLRLQTNFAIKNNTTNTTIAVSMNPHQVNSQQKMSKTFLCMLCIEKKQGTTGS